MHILQVTDFYRPVTNVNFELPISAAFLADVREVYARVSGVPHVFLSGKM